MFTWLIHGLIFVRYRFRREGFRSLKAALDKLMFGRARLEFYMWFLTFGAQAGECHGISLRMLTVPGCL